MQNSGLDYYHQLNGLNGNEIVERVRLNSAYVTIALIIMGGSVNEAAEVGALVGLATLVHALAIPLFPTLGTIEVVDPNVFQLNNLPYLLASGLWMRFCDFRSLINLG